MDYVGANHSIFKVYGAAIGVAMTENYLIAIASLSLAALVVMLGRKVWRCFWSECDVLC